LHPTEDGYIDWKERNVPWLTKFFRPPDDYVERWQASEIDKDRDELEFGTLYLLRRELVETAFRVEKIVPESVFARRSIEKRLFATTMLTCAGIDLLGKFLAGHDFDDDKKSKSRDGERFMNFCRRYVSNAQSPKIWELRNSMMHCFGLYISAEKEHRFTLTSDVNGSILKQIDRYEWEISASDLYWAFVEGIRKYENDVRNDNELEGHFAKMYLRYGALKMRR
jgi:hypothetical protein